LPEIPDRLERHYSLLFPTGASIIARFTNTSAAFFRTTLATTEAEIKKILEEPELQAILFDLDCIGDGPGDGIDVLEEMRKVRDDVVFAAFTRSTQRTIPLKASQAGADELFLLPLNYEELKIVLLRAIEKRSLELEGRCVIQQAESGVSFHGSRNLEAIKGRSSSISSVEERTFSRSLSCMSRVIEVRVPARA